MSVGQKHYEGHRARLRRRFLSASLDTFEEYEVVEMLLTLLIPRSDVKPAAKNLVQKLGNLRGILDAEPGALRAVPGIGSSTAENLGLLRSILSRYLQESGPSQDPKVFLGDLGEYCRVRLGNERVEVFRAFFLDPKLRVLGEEELERGTIDRASVYPRQVIEGAMKRGATGLVLAHNHPSGDTAPSDLDKVLTKAIALAGAPLDIRVVDHLVVSRDEVMSFRESGLL